MGEIYIEVPRNLNFEKLAHDFGKDAANWYTQRIDERIRNGAVYHNPLKTAYIWAAKDKKSHQGFFTTYIGFNNGRKKKNFGGS